MYGGGMVSPRKPMMMGGLAEKNRTRGSATPKTQDAMGMMTQQKKFDMGYNLGGAIKKFEKKSAGAKPDYIDLDNDGNTTESMKQAAKQKKSGKKAG
jgi:hypothetical protein